MLHVQNRCGADHPAIEPSGSVTDLIIVPTMMESAHKITKPSIKNNFFVQKHKLRRSFLIFVVSIGIKFEGGEKKPTSTFRQRLQQDKCLVSVATLLACLSPVERVLRLRAELRVWILSQNPLQLLEVVHPVEGLRCRGWVIRLI